MFTGSPAEGMQIRPEQEVVPLAEGDAQSPQRTIDSRPLTDTPAQGAQKGSGACVWLSIGGHKTRPRGA